MIKEYEFPRVIVMRSNAVSMMYLGTCRLTVLFYKMPKSGCWT